MHAIITKALDTFGIFIPFGSGNTPVNMGVYRRFNAFTQKEDSSFHFLPLSGIPTTLAQNYPREASPTGKSYAGIATAYIGVTQIPAYRTSVMTKQPDPIYKGDARLITTGFIDPFSSQVGLPQQKNGMAGLGLKWRG